MERDCVYLLACLFLRGETEIKEEKRDSRYRNVFEISKDQTLVQSGDDD